MENLPDREAYELQIDLLKEQLDKVIAQRVRAENKVRMYHSRLNTLQVKIANQLGVSYRDLRDHPHWRV
jgi:hypothetical protein